MTTMIFVNLPVRDLLQSMEFFGKLGFTFNPQFTDATAACMVVSETIYAMLLTEAKFQSFTPKPISDARQSTEVLIALSLDSRQAVESMVKSAVAAGGEFTPSQPITASCISTASRISTATSGSCSTWIQARSISKGRLKIVHFDAKTRRRKGSAKNRLHFL
jgi:predicted lactoylglutathione lyase